MIHFAALPCLLLTGCLTGGYWGSRNGAALPVIPLFEGNSWAYVDSAYFGDDSVSTDSTHIVIAGSRQVTLGGKSQTVFLWNVRNAAHEPGAVTLWLQNRRRGNYTVGAEQDTATFAFETLHVKYPAHKGERYPTYFLGFRTENSVFLPALDTLEIEVVNSDSLCRVPAGTFTCLHYRGWKPGGVLFADTWYAPGWGYLGSQQVRVLAVNGVDRSVTIVRRLARYTISRPD